MEVSDYSKFQIPTSIFYFWEILRQWFQFFPRYYRYVVVLEGHWESRVNDSDGGGGVFSSNYTDITREIVVEIEVKC